jgi:hypothetical protein
MRTFTIEYADRGRTATVTVQGNEIATIDEVLCIRHDGMSIATFPKDDVLHVTSRSDTDDWPAPAVDKLEPTPSRPADQRPYWTPVAPRPPLKRPGQRTTGVRVSRRVVTGTHPRVTR